MSNNNVATRQDIDEVIGIVRDFMQQVDEKFGQVDARFEAIDTRFDKIERDIQYLKESHSRLIDTIDGFIARIDKYETELAARDSQFEKLLAWARKVSIKTGIPLEDL